MWWIFIQLNSLYDLPHYQCPFSYQPLFLFDLYVQDLIDNRSIDRDIVYIVMKRDGKFIWHSRIHLTDLIFEMLFEENCLRSKPSITLHLSPWQAALVFSLIKPGFCYLFQLEITLISTFNLAQNKVNIAKILADCNFYLNWSHLV